MHVADAIGTMNRYGKERLPFLFMIDFGMKAPLVFTLREAQNAGVLFNFRGKGNFSPSLEPVRTFRFIPDPVSFEEYLRAFEIVMGHIRHGDSYLVNLTFPTVLDTDLGLRQIALHSRAPYVLMLPDRFVAFSPETFVRIDDQVISSCPMKGTIDASVADAERKILSDPKEIAEHNTIVDLIRNDLSMVSEKVHVERFRYIDRIKTHARDLLQVSSSIRGILPPDYNEHLGDLVFHLLPAGSVSGAPKRRTVEIIREAEKDDRGYYTGIAGYFDGHSLDSAVLIRYIETNQTGFTFRSGGGITCFSNPESEYRELLDKIYVPFY
jgi:para-aminobenzoate synthetase component 1